MISKILTLTIFCSGYAQAILSEDGRLDFTGLATKYGQRVEEHDVTTTDGYILKLFHIIGDGNHHVLLVHGAINSGDDFILRGNDSIGLQLAKRGYDLWAINHRGNRYSRRHLHLDPDTDAAFWDFSFTEFGEKDLPATIDYIQRRTGDKISVIGYSEGTTSTLVMGASRPEYNEKINVFIALTPVCYLRNLMPEMSAIIALSPDINKGLRRTKNEELLGYQSPISNFLTDICTTHIGYEICVLLVFPLTGYNQEEFEREFLLTLMGHNPAGTSRKNVNHFAQLARSKTFVKYDYGARNIEIYGSKTPPVFHLSKVTMKVALIVAMNDRITTAKDVSTLKKKLPNVVTSKVMERPILTHLDMVLGRSAYKVVLPHILEVLEKFSY